MTPRWQYEDERWVFWGGPVLLGSAAQVDRDRWTAWALGYGNQSFPSLTKAMAWVEKRAPEVV